LGSYASFSGPPVPPRTWKVPYLQNTTIRAIYKARQSIFKGGVRIPTSDDIAAKSPEWRNWAAGRRLEHIRLDKVRAFLKGLTIQQVIDSGYPRSGIVLLQHVYDFKHSGEFRVRCVARGDTQHEATVTLTCAPTASMYTVRLYFAIAIEEGHVVRHGDVPQAFLQGTQDTALFVWAPKTERKFAGECWQCLLPLYGFRSSAAYWCREARAFIESLGFEMDPMATCHFRKFLDDDQTIFCQMVLVVDDYSISGPEHAADHYHACFQQKFNATSESGKMFVGYDVDYNLADGYVKLSFSSYIARMIERFAEVDLSLGAPYRELFGCISWCSQNCHGPEMVRVRSHGAALNSFTDIDYDAAIDTMHHIASLSSIGIVYRRHGAGKEFVPPSARPNKIVTMVSPPVSPHQGHFSYINEFEERDLYTADDHDDTRRFAQYPINDRYRISNYVDSSFAADHLMRSVTGSVTLLNGGPMEFQVVVEGLVVESTTSSETLGYSTAIKSVKHLELRLKFFHVQPPKPYSMYTDSSGGKLLAANPNKLGRVRHLCIRHHMVKCYIQIGDIDLIYCVTEAQLGDVMTKICDASQRLNLGLRFYNDCIFPEGRCYKVECHERDCVVRVATPDDYNPQILAQPVPVPVSISPDWTLTQLDTDSPFPVSDPQWCSKTASKFLSNL